MTALPSSQLLPFVIFAFVASITPGPTNLLILSCAVRHGLLTTMPIVIGAAAGAAGLLLVVGLGLSGLLLRYPLLQQGMAWAGMLWIGWLAWQLFRNPATGIQAQDSSARPGLALGAGLQLINPKTWMMALSVVSVFVGAESDMATYGLHAIIFMLVALPCLATWALLGWGAARFIASPMAMQRFNQGMALILVASAALTLMR